MSSVLDRNRDRIEELDTSRATAGRALRELDSVGLARYADGVWKPTPSGRCVDRATDDFAGRLEDHVEAAPVVDRLRLDDPLDRSFIDGADVYESDLDAPRAVTTMLLDSIEGASVVHVATPVLFPGFGETFYERIADSDCSLEMVVPDEVFECAHGTNPSVTGSC